jgi:hypothetical protein
MPVKTSVAWGGIDNDPFGRNKLDQLGLSLFWDKTNLKAVFQCEFGMGVLLPGNQHSLLEDRPVRREQPAMVAAPLLSVVVRQFRLAEDRSDNIVQIVSNTAGKSTDRLHAAGLLQIYVQSRALINRCSRMTRLACTAATGNAQPLQQRCRGDGSGRPH